MVDRESINNAAPRMGSAEALRTIGEALWADHWRTPMARALGVTERTIWRWANGQNPTPAWAIEDLTELLRAHHARIGELIERKRDEK